MTQKLSVYSRSALGSSEASFAKAHPHAVLVISSIMSGPEDTFLTQQLQMPKDGRVSAILAAETSVGVLTKRPNSNPFGSFVTVGRAANNDIVLNVPEVSKVHAYFMRDHNRNHLIRDAHSTNGTFVNDNRVSPSESTLLRTKDVVRFGDYVSAVFLSPEDFYDFLTA